jgi:predicted glutamine amidotransferase
MRFMEHQGLRTRMAISHIRLATFGDRALRNTQPFLRELGGRMHAFAHNGDFPSLLEPTAGTGGALPPVGDTDSELAFCGLLDRLAPLWHEAAGARAAAGGAARRHRRLRDRAAPLGPANFLYADADALFVHADRRTQMDGRIQPPGLYLLQRCCWRSAPELADSGVDLRPSARTWRWWRARRSRTSCGSRWARAR